MTPHKNPPQNINLSNNLTLYDLLPKNYRHLDFCLDRIPQGMGVDDLIKSLVDGQDA